MGDDTVRFTVELPQEVTEALDNHCDEQTDKASRAVGAKVKVGRSRAIEAILRKAFKLPAVD